MNPQRDMEFAEPDPFRWAYEASETHRAEHGLQCNVYPTSSGPLLGWLASALRVRRALEVGCGLGYSALWIAQGCAPNGRVETIEAVPEHAELARANFQRAGVETRVSVRVGGGLALIPTLVETYDFVFLDGDWSEYPAYVPHLLRLVRQGGVIVSSNIFPHDLAPDMPGQAEASEYLREIFSHPGLRSTLLRRSARR